MKTLQPASLWAYAVLSLAHIGASIVGHRELSAWTKPWLMLALATWFLSATPLVRRFLRSSILAGLLFCAVGDVLLLFDGEAFFLTGLFAFLLAQLSYAGGFIAEVGRSKGFLHQSPLSAVAVLSFLIGFLYWLLPGVPVGLRLPVVLYSAALTGMVLSVLHARWRLGEVAFSQAMSGALLFLLSDCLLAAARFKQPFTYSDAAIMGTYLLGQWLLTRGAAAYIRQQKRKQKEAIY